MPQIPQTPLPSAVSFENRISLLLNRSGSQRINPIIGTGKTGQVTEGANVRVKFSLSDAAEEVFTAKVESFDDDGNITSTSNIKSLFTYDTTNLLATANLVAGSHFATDSLGVRSIITVRTTRERIMKQQLWVADKPTDIVVLDGVVTTAADPLVIRTDLNVPYQIPVAFFASWNDEVGRVHGLGQTTRNTNKPYGGMKTVAITSTGGGPTTSETNIEDVKQVAFTPTVDGQQVTFTFTFRAETGASDTIVAQAYVKFIECNPIAGPQGIPAGVGAGPLISIMNSGVIGADSIGPTIQVQIDYIPAEVESASNADITLTLKGYTGGVTKLSGGSADAVANVLLGTQTETYTSSGQKTIQLDSVLQDATLIVVEATAIEGSATAIGNSLIYATDDSDLGIPDPPTVSAISFDFTLDRLTYTLDDIGWTGETVTIHVRQLQSIIATGGGSAQEQSDLAVDVSLGDLTATAEVGSGKQKDFTLDSRTTAVAIWFTNSRGSSSVITFGDDGTVDYGSVIKYPAISAFTLVDDGLGGTKNKIQFTLDDDGNNPGQLTPIYIIVDSAQNYVQENKGAIIANGTGARSFTVSSGHDDIDGHYFLGLISDQGGLVGDLLHVSNVGGANTLPGGS